MFKIAAIFLLPFLLHADEANIVSTRPRLADRVYVASVLRDLFGPGAQEKINEYILAPDSVMGGACDYYSQIRTGPGPNDFHPSGGRCLSGKMAPSIPMVPQANLVREGYVMKACEYLTNTRDTFTYFLAQTLGSGGNEVTDDRLTKVFQSFQPAKTPTPQVLAALRKVAAATTRDQNAWRSITLTLCMDPQWQVL